ncbi:hypothetical protein D3C86_1979610 [compost metagenome]
MATDPNKAAVARQQTYSNGFPATTIGALSADVTAVEASVTAVEVSVAALEIDVADHEDRIVVLEGV